MMHTRWSVISGLVSFSVAAAILGVCAPAAAVRVVVVGRDFPTIQAAIDAAQEGDGSPCIGAGTSVGDAPITDLDGRPRVRGAAPDLGCYARPL